MAELCLGRELGFLGADHPGIFPVPTVVGKPDKWEHSSRCC